MFTNQTLGPFGFWNRTYNNMNFLIWNSQCEILRFEIMKTWRIKGTVYDIHGARIRERLRQGGILVVNPTDMFDTCLKRGSDPWHFLCFTVSCHNFKSQIFKLSLSDPKSKYVAYLLVLSRISTCQGLGRKSKHEILKCIRSHHDGENVARGCDATLHSLETLMSHVVLIARHVIKPNVVSKTRERTWAADMEPKSVNAHFTLAIQNDPREDVLPLSYSRRTNDQGAGTIDLQRLEEVGIEPGLLRGRVPKARTQPYDVYRFRLEYVNNAALRHGVRRSWTSVDASRGVWYRNGRASLCQCFSYGGFLKGQVLAGGRWFDVAADTLWESRRHAGTKDSVNPFHWMIFQSARQTMIPSAGSLCDLSPWESSSYYDNYFSQCSRCEQSWWIVDTPVLGICPVCEGDVIGISLGIRATLEASLHEPYKRFPEAEGRSTRSCNGGW